MTTHLNKDRFFRKTTTGTLMLKRVGADLEVRFPRKYREVYRDAYNAGRAPAAVLCKYLMNGPNYCGGLSTAWQQVKFMFNGA